MDQSENERRGLGTAFVVFVPHAIQTARAGPFCSTFQYADTNPADFARLPGRGVRGCVGVCESCGFWAKLAAPLG